MLCTYLCPTRCRTVCVSYSSALDPEPYALYLPVPHQVSDLLRELLLNPRP